MALNEWYILARLAELAERGQAELVNRATFPKHEYRFTVKTEHVIENELSDEEQGQLCEMLSSRFMERAIALGVTGAEKKDCLSEQNCITCLALPHVWCRPTHPGERDAGGWLHPERESGETLIGALRDAKHISSAMARFPQMQFSSNRTRGIAYAQILHAGLKFGLSMDYWSSNATDLITAKRRREYEDNDVLTARGTALDALAFDLMGLQRLSNESDAYFRERVETALDAARTPQATAPSRFGTYVSFYTNPQIADAGWVGRDVRLVDAETVMLTSHEEAYGYVARVHNNNSGRSTVDVIPWAR